MQVTDGQAPNHNQWTFENFVSMMKEGYKFSSIETESFIALVSTHALNNLSKDIHQSNVEAGWWTDLKTGESTVKTRNVGELLCLVHSEISEAMEGHRKGLQDDKLPHRRMFEVEIADALIRIFDLAGAHNLDLDGAVREKRAFNKARADHKIENRKAAGGKAY